MRSQGCWWQRRLSKQPPNNQTAPASHPLNTKPTTFAVVAKRKTGMLTKQLGNLLLGTDKKSFLSLAISFYPLHFSFSLPLSLPSLFIFSNTLLNTTAKVRKRVLLFVRQKKKNGMNKSQERI